MSFDGFSQKIARLVYRVKILENNNQMKQN